jgi:hypothetical protein
MRRTDIRDIPSVCYLLGIGSRRLIDIIAIDITKDFCSYCKSALEPLFSTKASNPYQGDCALRQERASADPFFYQHI